MGVTRLTTYVHVPAEYPKHSSTAVQTATLYNHIPIIPPLIPNESLRGIQKQLLPPSSHQLIHMWHIEGNGFGAILGIVFKTPKWFWEEMRRCTMASVGW